MSSFFDDSDSNDEFAVKPRKAKTPRGRRPPSKNSISHLFNDLGFNNEVAPPPKKITETNNEQSKIVPNSLNTDIIEQRIDNYFQRKMTLMFQAFMDDLDILLKNSFDFNNIVDPFIAQIKKLIYESIQFQEGLSPSSSLNLFSDYESSFLTVFRSGQSFAQLTNSKKLSKLHSLRTELSNWYTILQTFGEKESTLHSELDDLISLRQDAYKTDLDRSQIHDKFHKQKLDYYYHKEYQKNISQGFSKQLSYLQSLHLQRIDLLESLKANDSNDLSSQLNQNFYDFQKEVDDSYSNLFSKLSRAKRLISEIRDEQSLNRESFMYLHTKYLTHVQLLSKNDLSLNHSFNQSNSSYYQNSFSFNQNNSSLNHNKSSLNPNNSFVNPKNSFINQNKSTLNPNNSFVNQNKSSLSQNNSFVNPNNSFVNPNNSFVNQNKSSLNSNNSFINQNNSFINQNKSSLNPNNSFVNSNNSFVNQNNLPLDQNNLPLDQNNPPFDQNNPSLDQDNSFVNQNNPSLIKKTKSSRVKGSRSFNKSTRGNQIYNPNLNSVKKQYETLQEIELSGDTPNNPQDYPDRIKKSYSITPTVLQFPFSPN